MAADKLIQSITSTDRQAKDVAYKLMRQVRERMERKHGRHSPARPGQLVDLERSWREQMPQASRLGYATDWLKNRRGEPKGLTIHDFRASALGLRSTGWDKDHAEMGLCLVLIAAHIMPDDVQLKVQEQAIVLRHAIARRYERGYPATDEAVIEDLRHVAHARMTTPELGLIECESGRWAGRLSVYDDHTDSEQLLVVNTFLPPNMRGNNYVG